MRSIRFFHFALRTAVLASSSIAGATPVFDFATDLQSWSNQASEPFAVSFGAGQGLGGDGVLVVSATVPRDSFQLVHAVDSDWSASPYAYSTLSFDVFLGAGVSIRMSTTGIQIRDAVSSASNVYLASSTQDLADGWTRVFLTATSSFDLPLSHDDLGINLHIGTTSAFADSFVMRVDNITSSASTSPPTSSVSEPAPLPLVTLAALASLAFGRRRLRH